MGGRLYSHEDSISKASSGEGWVLRKAQGMRRKRFWSRLFNQWLTMTQFNIKLKKLNKLKIKGYTDE